jgi:chromosome segregation ATPase
MLEPVVLIGALFVLILAVVVYTTLRRENDIRSLKKDVISLQSALQERAKGAPTDLARLGLRIKEFDIKLELLRNQFMKILVPIRQNSEDIDELDADLARLQGLYEEIKKRGELEPPPAAA